MKNSNLLNRLLSYSHEKQSPQRFGRYAVMLLMLLTLGVGQMWAKTVYIDISSFTDYNSQIYVHYWGSGEAYKAASSAGTNLYKVDNVPDGASWQVLRSNGGSGDGDRYNYQNNCSSSDNIYHVTGWNNSGSSEQLDILPKQKYIYFDVSGSNADRWRAADFNTKFNWYSVNGVFSSATWCKSKLSDGVYYTQVPNTDHLGQVQLCRMNPSNDGDEWNSSGTAKADNDYNCLYVKSENKDWWNTWIPGWTTYAPPLSAVSLSDNGTTILAGGGTESNPYLIATGATIKVVASGTKAVADPDATIWYDIKDNTTSKQNSSTAACSFTASATANTVYQMKVDGYTKVSSTSSTKLTSDIIYYKTVSVKDISVYIYVGGHSDGDINSVEMNGCTPYVGIKALTAVKINNRAAGDPKFTLSGNWLYYTFTNVTKVSNITCARSGGNIFTGEITDNVYYTYEGTSLPGQCIQPANPTWGTAPASGAIGGSMTATVSGAPDGATITWSSTDGDVASVNSSTGVISYEAAGSATIKANVSWSASVDYCAGSYELSQAITVTSGATVSATRACPEYVSTNSGQVKLDISSTGASTGWYYRVCNSTKTAYYAPDEQSAASNTLSWTMNGSLPTGSNTLVVELYNSARQLVCTSSSVTVNVEIAESVTISAGANGSVSPSGTVYANNNHVHPTITAIPDEYYHFKNWTSSNAAASVADANNATTTVTATASGYTITANFAGDQYTITYKDQGDVAYTGNNEGSLPATHTYGTATALVNGTKNGYNFVGWYTDASCTVSAGSSIGATAYTANITLYAKWTENMSALSTSCSYDAGTPGYAAPTVSNSATTIGYDTYRTITATAAGTGYAFAGWTLTNCTRTDGGSPTATSITVRSNGDGAAVTVVANYNEVLTSDYYVEGNSSGLFTYGWNANANTMMMKRSGYSTSSEVYWELEVPAAKTSPGDNDWNFKIYRSSDGAWFGWGPGENDSKYWLTKESNSVGLHSSDAADVLFKSYIEGTYVFHLDYSNTTYPTLTVTWPVVNQLRVSAASPADATNVNNFDLADKGSNNWSVKRTLNANTTYTFKMVYDGAWYGDGHAFTRASNTTTGLGDGDNMTLKTDVAGEYTFTFNSSSKNLEITYPTAYTVTYGVGTNYSSMGSVSTSPSVTSGNYVLAGSEIAFTATPNLGYKFVGWYREAACTNLVSASNPYEPTISATTTLYAKFAYRDLYIHADWLSWGTAQMTQSTVNRAIYSYEIDPLAVKSGTPSTAEGGHHFQFVNTAVNPNDHIAYDYYGVQTPTGSGYLVDGDIHLTDPGNATIQFDLTRKSKITITLTLQTIDDVTKPTLNIDADPYYTVNTAKGGSGSAGTSVSPASVEARSGANSAEITASINPGYSLVNWTASSANITINSPNSTTTTVRASADGTITANVRAHTYTIHFNGHGNTGGGTADQAAVVYNVSTALTANGFTKTGYTFAGWATSEDGEKVYDDEASVLGLTTTDNGTVNLWAVWTPNNYTVTFDATTNGGTCETESKSVTFGSAYGELPEASHASRQFIGWYTTASDDPTPGTRVTAETIVSTASDHTLYARFESTFEVTVTYKCGEDVLYPSNKVYASSSSLAADISAPTILGYSFSGWIGTNVTFGNASSATTTVNASAMTTITATYTAVPTVYFKNNLGWEEVYVTFDCGFNSGKDNAPSNYGKPYYKMNQLGSSDVFYYEIPSQYSSSWAWNIAFDNTGYDYETVEEDPNHYGTYDAFWKGEFVGRGDFDQKTTMYIPYNGDTETRNEGTFYKTGCWMKYNSTESGYQVNMNEWVTGEHDDLTTVALTAPVAGGYEFSATIDLEEANYSYGFKLYKIYQTNDNDIWYSNKGTITAATDNLPWEFAAKIGDEEVTATTQRCELHTEALGNYTITVSFATGRPMVDVEYPVSVGDWRLVYKDLATWSNGAHTAGWSHPSRVIKAKANAEDIVSFFVSKAEGASAEVELHKCTDIDGETGAQTWEQQGGDLDISDITGTGIYNFKVTQNGSKVATATYDGSYDGNFYIRTDASDGGWSNYKTSGTNVMTYSEYAKEQENSTYTHYYMRFVNTGTNIKFCIANDYSECISDTLVSDTYTNEWIEAYANVRFMWDHRTNKVSRAYISGSSIVSDRFLVLEGSPKMFNESGQDLTTAGGGKVGGLNDYEMNFGDDQNWIYEATIKAKPGAKALLTAKYNNKIQYFGGSGPAVTDSVTLLGGLDTNKYKIRVVYDFKTNRLIKAFIPDGAIGTDLEIDADLMIIRDHQADAQQITFNEGGALSKVKTVYGALMFNKWTLNNKDRENQETLSLSRYERDLFYISFPFDVKLSEVFGFGTYGKHWILEYYDGKGRAANGFWADSDPNWKFVMPAQRSSFTMKAFEGYILALDLDELTESSLVWNNNVENVYLYFPSTAEVEDIEATNRLIPIDQDGYECKINRPTPDGNRTIKDSYWHCIGVPSFANYNSTLYDIEDEETRTAIDWTNTSMPYLYTINWADKSLSITSSATFSFKATFSYLVQYAGSTIYWSQVNVTPSSVVARERTAPTNTEFRLELQKNGQKDDQTFVRLSDDENVTTGFDFNYDLSKEFNKNKANIYTMVTTIMDDGPSITQTAGNVLPMSDQTTVVPVGVKIASAGDYTFAIPEGTNGVGVTLIDNETGIRTSLSALDYTISLPAGTYDNRFVLEISPIRPISTDLENTEYRIQNTDVCKVLIDGILYIVKDGVMYDARGNRVQ